MENPDSQLAAAYERDDFAGMAAAIRAGANPDTRFGKRPLIITASAPGHVELVEALLRHGVDVDASMPPDNVTALMFVAACATTRDQVRVLELLVESGADVNARDRRGHSVLDAAIMAENRMTAEVLAAHGALCSKASALALEQLRSSAEDKGREGRG